MPSHYNKKNPKKVGTKKLTDKQKKNLPKNLQKVILKKKSKSKK